MTTPKTINNIEFINIERTSKELGVDIFSLRPNSEKCKTDRMPVRHDKTGLYLKYPSCGYEYPPKQFTRDFYVGNE